MPKVEKPAPIHVYYPGHLGEEAFLDIGPARVRFRRGEIRAVPRVRSLSPQSGFHPAVAVGEIAERYKITARELAALADAGCITTAPYTEGEVKREMFVLDPKSLHALAVLRDTAPVLRALYSEKSTPEKSTPEKGNKK